VKAGVAALVALVVLGCGCGGSSGSVQGTTTTAFAWLRAAPAPAGWHTTRTAAGAVLAYPPAWRTIHGDPGTASAALGGSDGAIVGYLNATPAIPSEMPARWAAFRVDHNAEEGDHNVKVIAHARGLRFRSGGGACVVDSYRTSARAYTEIACLVGRTGHSTVIVAAAASELWNSERADLHRAIDAFMA
jgi:hypothetical protein